MNPKKHHYSAVRFFATFWLFLGWLAQVVPLAAFSAPADWKFETLQNASEEWWQTLSVETVPGVVYHLQKSTTLEPGDWNTVATTCGTGAKWVCPIFPGSGPSVAPPPGTLTLPATPVAPIRIAFLVLEKTTIGGTLISWSSLDDHTSRRELLAGVTLDPAWDDFDGGYINGHGNYLFGISPRLTTPVIFTAGATTLGPLDTAMIAAFTAALPTITANIQTSIANAAHYNPQQDNSGEKAFYRFSADWSVDSDGDGRLDWEELVLDGNNPFVTDTDGDGTPDQPVGAPAAGSGIDSVTGLPLPLDDQGPTPRATIETQYINSYRSILDYHDGTTPSLIGAGVSQSEEIGLTGMQITAMKNVSSYAAFKSVVDDFSIEERAWQPLYYSGVNYDNEWHEASPGTQTSSQFWYTRSRFRLKLNAPAPPGGYHIPLRLAKVIQTYDTTTEAYGVTDAVRVEMMLDCEEGQTEGIAKDLPTQDPPENKLLSYYPVSVDLDGYNKFEFDSDITPVDKNNGICITPNGRITATAHGVGGVLPQSTKIYWQQRKLNGEGMLGEWSYLYPPNPAEEQYEGSFVTMEAADPGIYQFQAVISFSNGMQVEVPYVRMQHARSIVNSDNVANALLVSGQPDYFGVSPNDDAIFVRNKAVLWLGSTAYRRLKNWVITEPGADFNPNTTNSSKCNLFITHVANQVGARTPYFPRWGGLISSAPLAKEDWYGDPEVNVDLDVPGWEFKGVPASPTPGMSVASPHAGTDAKSGHVGILDYDGSWINAGAKTVNKSVHLKDSSPTYKPNNMRSR